MQHLSRSSAQRSRNTPRRTIITPAKPGSRAKLIFSGVRKGKQYSTAASTSLGWGSPCTRRGCAHLSTVTLLSALPPVLWVSRSTILHWPVHREWKNNELRPRSSRRVTEYRAGRVNHTSVCYCHPVRVCMSLHACAHMWAGLCTVCGGMANAAVCVGVQLQNGFAVVRPPGHHAEESTPMWVPLPSLQKPQHRTALFLYILYPLFHCAATAASLHGSEDCSSIISNSNLGTYFIPRFYLILTVS